MPADTAVVLGAFLSGAGQVSAWLVFVVTWAANVSGAAGVYLAARSAGRPFFEGRIGRKLLAPTSVDRIHRFYARYGLWGMLLSRFVPGVRAVVPPFAGLAGLRFVQAMVPIAVGSALWYGALTWIAATVVHRADDAVALIGKVNRWAILFGVVVGLGIGAWVLLHRIKVRRSRLPDA